MKSRRFIAVDHNQIVMQTLKRVASRHGMKCLLHEKPFAGVNGSGKHNNWSLITDDGINMLEPGKTPHENIQFLLVLACILKAVDEHADLLRESAADPGIFSCGEKKRSTDTRNFSENLRLIREMITGLGQMKRLRQLFPFSLESSSRM